MADDFGQAVYTVSVTSDAELRAQMQALEGVVRQSTDNMQNDFTQLNTTIGTTGDVSGVATAGVTALGQAATATGSSALMAAGNIANLGLGLKLLGSSALGATGQLKAMGAGLVKFLVSPAGLVVVAIAAIGTAIAVTFSETARNKIAGIGLGLRDILDTNELLAERLKQQETDIKTRIQLLDDAIILETTGVNRALERITLEERDKILLLERVKAHNAIANSIIKEKSATLDRLDALRQEAQILRGERDTVDFITNALERQATIERDRARFAKDAADAKDRERRAWEGIVAARGPRTGAEARDAIWQARTLVDATQHGLALLTTEFDKFVRRMAIDAEEEKLLRTQLGLPEKAKGVTGAGFIEAAAFTTSGRGAPGGGGDPWAAEGRRLETRRTKAIEDTANNTKELLAIRRGPR